MDLSFKVVYGGLVMEVMMVTDSINKIPRSYCPTFTFCARV